MDTLSHKGIRLRAPEMSDAELLYAWENAPSVWSVSRNRMPVSLQAIRELIAGQDTDPVTSEQQRLMVDSMELGRPVGSVDLYGTDIYNLRTGIGILIAEPEDRRRGYASAALEAVAAHMFGTWGFRQLWCEIPVSNTACLSLFRECGYSECGHLRAWLRRSDGWEDITVMQLLNPAAASI